MWWGKGIQHDLRAQESGAEVPAVAAFQVFSPGGDCHAAEQQAQRAHTLPGRGGGGGGGETRVQGEHKVGETTVKNLTISSFEFVFKIQLIIVFCLFVCLLQSDRSVFRGGERVSAGVHHRLHGRRSSDTSGTAGGKKLDTLRLTL